MADSSSKLPADCAPATQQQPSQRTLVELVRYLLLGGANFFLTLAIFAVLTKAVGVNYLVSLIAAWLVGMLFMYVTNFLWVFTANGRLLFDDRLVRFIGVGILSITTNSAALRAIVEHWQSDPFWTQMALMPFVVVFNFAATKYFSLRVKAEETK